MSEDIYAEADTKVPDVKIKLKGGSLSGTYLMTVHGVSFVRKEISLKQNREYGYVRWHSQLKKMQRLGSIFPDLFPKVLDFGVVGNNSYFDLEYINGSVNAFDFLASNPSDEQVDVFFKELIKAMDRLHRVKRSSSPNGLRLYISEEIERPLTFCAQDSEFQQFLKYKTIIYNGTSIPSIAHNIPKLYEIAKKHYKYAEECYTHGNITLENILWVPKEQRLLFIDVYEENIADTILNEYSQILQSSNSYYEVFNAMNARVEGNEVSIETKKYPAIDYFNNKFTEFLQKKLTDDELIIVKLYELSQFTRMLPFKLHVSRDKMVFFYSLASSLFSDLLKKAGSKK